MCGSGALEIPSKGGLGKGEVADKAREDEEDNPSTGGTVCVVRIQTTAEVPLWCCNKYAGRK